MLKIIINTLFLIVFSVAILSETVEYLLTKKEGMTTRVDLTYYIALLIIYTGLALTAISFLFYTK